MLQADGCKYVSIVLNHHHSYHLMPPKAMYVQPHGNMCADMIHPRRHLFFCPSKAVVACNLPQFWEQMAGTVFLVVCRCGYVSRQLTGASQVCFCWFWAYYAFSGQQRAVSVPLLHAVCSSSCRSVTRCVGADSCL